MAIIHFSCALSAWYRDGRPLEPKQMARDLGASEVPFKEIFSQERFTGLNIAEIAASEFGDHYERPEACEEFDVAMRAALLKFAEWLSQIPIENIGRMRDESFYAWVIINLWIDGDQMDLYILPPLSRELGRLELELYVLSNE
jgi:hypothetical protein